MKASHASCIAAQVRRHTTITCLITIAAFSALCVFVEGILKKG